MTNKEAIRNALEYYILVNAATGRDPEGKVNAAKRCLEELNLSEEVTKDWILLQSPMLLMHTGRFKKL